MEQNESRADGIRRIARKKKLNLEKTDAEDLIVIMRHEGLLDMQLALDLCNDFADNNAAALLRHARSIDDLDERIEQSKARI